MSESAVEVERGAGDVLRVSEVFDSLQGEGPTSGAPCRFLRLALCNLHCRYCDTKYTWDFEHYDFRREVARLSLTEAVDLLRGAPAKHVVITGGEPLLQQRALCPVLEQVPREVYVEVETNGTRVPLPSLLERVDQWNVSPKLSTAGDPEEQRLRPEALGALRESGRAFLKLVVRTAAERDEAEALRLRFGFAKERTLLMPEAATAAELAERAPSVAAWSQALGVRFSHRLHLALWGGRRGT